MLFYYGILIPISYLPYPVLYVLSDGLYILLFRIIGYRKAVVIKNIRNSFPEKSEKEQLQIVDAFYKHLCDLIVESIKVFSISENQIHQRMKILNPEYINKYFEQNQSVILAGGHFNNWELFAVAIDAAIKHDAVAIYKPLSNLFFDEKMRYSRGKFGLKMISTKAVRQEFEKTDGLRVIIFGIDQFPGNHRDSYRTKFLSQDSAMAFGAEKYAKEFNYPVLSGRINKVKRGHYEFEFTDAIETPQATSYGEITNRINLLLENDIILKPQYWLWSHKRWKLPRPVESVQV